MFSQKACYLRSLLNAMCLANTTFSFRATTSNILFSLSVADLLQFQIVVSVVDVAR
jgi:hypothetical protein